MTEELQKMEPEKLKDQNPDVEEVSESVKPYIRHSNALMDILDSMKQLQQDVNRIYEMFQTAAELSQNYEDPSERFSKRYVEQRNSMQKEVKELREHIRKLESYDRSEFSESVETRIVEQIESAREIADRYDEMLDSLDDVIEVADDESIEILNDKIGMVDADIEVIYKDIEEATQNFMETGMSNNQTWQQEIAQKAYNDMSGMGKLVANVRQFIVSFKSSYAKNAGYEPSLKAPPMLGLVGTLLHYGGLLTFGFGVLSVLVGIYGAGFTILFIGFLMLLKAHRTASKIAQRR